MRHALPGLALLLLVGCAYTTSAGGNPNAAPNSAASSQNRTYVCHNSRWKKVATNAVDAHRRHGDRVTTSDRNLSGACS